MKAHFLKGCEVTTHHFDRVIIQELAWEIAQAKADEHPEIWEKDDSDSSMRRTVVAAMNLHGWPADGIPGNIPLILKMLEGGEIEAFSTFNELPCTEFELVKTNPANWFISGEDANQIRVAMKLDQFTVKGIGAINTMNRSEFEKYQIALANRRALGRYTLEEAAIFIFEATGSRPEIMQSKLMEAARTGALTVYEPGMNDRYLYGGDFASRVRNFYEEAKGQDLNTWLEQNEPNLICKFPETDAHTAKVEAVAVTPPAPAAKGITKNAVIGAFEGLHYNADQWKKLLGDQDAKWLLPARVARGDKNTSALWNPTVIALTLLDKEIPIRKLDAVFVSLNDWADEWREKSAYFRD